MTCRLCCTLNWTSEFSARQKGSDGMTQTRCRWLGWRPRLCRVVLLLGCQPKPWYDDLSIRPLLGGWREVFRWCAKLSACTGFCLLFCFWDRISLCSSGLELVIRPPQPPECSPTVLSSMKTPSLSLSSLFELSQKCICPTVQCENVLYPSIGSKLA